MNERPETATYLDLPFAWTASRRFAHGQASEYQMPLGPNDLAVLELSGGSGWMLTIVHGGTRPSTRRGLFATPHDALMVLVSEYGPALFPAGTQSPSRRAV